MSRVIDADGVALVKQFEGLYTQAYRCPAGVWTIGYGHTDGVTPGMSISEKQAEKYLKDDLAAAGEQVGRLVKVPLNNHQFAALASFVFNVGAGSLAGSTLLRRLNGGDYQCVPSELAKWVKATDPRTGQRISLPGLVKRRAAEGVLWLKREDNDAFANSTEMPQSVQADDERHIYSVIAREGLRLRAGAGVQFDVLQLVPFGTRIYVQREKDNWAAVDLQGDGAVDGWMNLDFLKLISH